MSKRKIAIFTAGRAEYGLLRPLIAELNSSKNLDIGLFVTGMHLSHEFGYTVQEIEKDGYPIWERLEGLLAGDSEAAICKSMGLTTIGVSEALQRHQPDLLVLLGDRYELLAAAQAAMIHKIPIAHLHGGEATEGLIDEAIRHSITKMSHLHFVSTDDYRRRVIQMGENPDRVFNTGAVGLDNILSLSAISQDDLEDDLGIDLSKQTFLVTYHPVTLSNKPPRESVLELINALEHFEDSNFIFTHPNSDTNGREIVAPIEAFVARNKERSILVESLGVRRYLSVMKLAAGVIGNSSSGIIETPSFGIPTINIGTRQKGRVQADSVLNCEEISAEITAAIVKSQSSEFLKIAKACVSPYGDGKAAGRIAKEIEQASLDGILMKSFQDMDLH